MSELMVAATPRLLEGWCGPVVIHWASPPDDGGFDEDSPEFEPAPFVEGTVYSGCAGDWLTIPDPVLGFAILLDLRRAECRDRVARVLLGRGLAAAWWAWTPGGGGWALGSAGPDSASAARIYPRAMPVAVTDIQDQTWVEVPALVALDPLDDTRLPDGSRAVDAHALAIVARHVLASDPTTKPQSGEERA